jgi:DNA-binding transcriptional ArsR family regulator
MNEGNRPTTDEVFELLADRHRRYVLAYLRDASTPVSLPDLATELARVESESDAAEGMADRRRQLFVRLHHVHVPSLADAGLVEHDRERNTAELSADDETIEALSQLLPEVRETVAATTSE